MKVLFICVAFWLTKGFAFNFSCELPINDENWLVPDVLKGTLEWITRPIVEAEIESLEELDDLVEYNLYTATNPTSAQKLVLGDPPSIRQSNFNKSNPTRIIVHGYRSSQEEEICTAIRDAYLETGLHNVICLDWAEIASTTYVTARFSTLSIGYDLAEFINFLSQYGGMSRTDLTLIGHSLGAHIAGFAGKILQKSNNTLPVIIACDPANPLFTSTDCSSRICKTDADFVESIQTSAGKFGFIEPIGDATYYPNGGFVQPGCGLDLIGTCAHSRSHEYFAEAILYNDFPSKKCKTAFKAFFNLCGDIDNSIQMGTIESFGIDGVFYVPVNSESPYGNLSSS